MDKGHGQARKKIVNERSERQNVLTPALLQQENLLSEKKWKKSLKEC